MNVGCSTQNPVGHSGKANGHAHAFKAHCNKAAKHHQGRAEKHKDKSSKHCHGKGHGNGKHKGHAKTPAPFRPSTSPVGSVGQSAASAKPAPLPLRPSTSTVGAVGQAAACHQGRIETRKDKSSRHCHGKGHDHGKHKGHAKAPAPFRPSTSPVGSVSQSAASAKPAPLPLRPSTSTVGAVGQAAASANPAPLPLRPSTSTVASTAAAAASNATSGLAGISDLESAFQQAIASARAVLEISTKGNSHLAAIKSKPNA